MDLEPPGVSVVNATIGERVARAYRELSGMHKRAADFVLARPFDAATMTIEEFAAVAQISTATANRFARALGFKRYADFRSEIVQAVRPPRAPEEKLRTQPTAETAPTIITHSLREDISNLSKTAAALAATHAEAAVDMLLRSRRIFTVGFGTSGYLASYAANLLDPISADARFVAVEGGTEQTARRLLKLGPRHVLIAITFPRYSKDIVATVQVAKARGARVLAITDGPKSPIVSLADVTLYAFAERQFLSSSAVAGLALIEALASAVMRRRKGAVDAMTKLTQQVLPYLQEDDEDLEVRPSRQRKKS